MNKLMIKSTLAAAITLGITGCTSTDNEGVAGIGGSGYVSSGSISGFGSVFVNGVEFETDSSTFDVDGIPGTQDDLAIGMIVQVNGSINADGVTGNATSISYDDELQGPVEEGTVAYDLDRVTASFTVLGVNVIIDSGSTSFDIDDDLPANTVFDFDSIADKNNIEVSGFFDSSGSLKATRVELKDVTFDSSSIVEVKGTISAPSGTTFSLTGFTGLTVDAASATLDDLPNGLADGLYVEVKGTFNTTTNTLTATKVEAEDDSIEDADEFEIEGIITDYVDDSNFKIDGIPVDASNATLEPATLNLANDIQVEAEGAIVNGILVASEIEAEGGDLKVHALVTAVPPATAANTFEVSPVAGEPAITVTVTTSTQFEDGVDEDKFFNIDDLVANTHFVEVEGFDDGNGGFTAVEIDVKEVSKVVVQGYATAAIGSAAGGSITVMGVTFDFDGNTDFENESDDPLTPSLIEDLINDIKNTSTAPQLIKIEDKDEGGGPDGIADEIDKE